MLTFAINRFNQSLLSNNAAHTLNDDTETLADNYNLRAAKKNGNIEPTISDNLVYGDNVKGLTYQRFTICCFSNAFKASL